MTEKTTEYFLQRPDDIWEKVDDFTFKNWEKAVTADDTKRYNGNRVLRTPEGRLSVITEAMTPKDFGTLLRFLGISHNDSPPSVPGGFLRSPEFVKFRRGSQILLHETNGETFIKKAA
jgi:hypothetical protein